MYRARSLASAIVATLATAAALAGVAWFGAVLAARGTSQAILPTLLTTNNFAALEWPYRADQPPVAVHVAFYVAVALVALLAGLVTLLATRRASPRNGAAALLGTWLGVVIGSVAAAVSVYFVRLDALAPTAAARNDVLASLLRDFAFGGLLLGLVPALLSWATFKLANRTRAAEYTTAMDRSEGRNVDENPFDLAPDSNGSARPVEPGFTYPAGDTVHDGSYRDADLPPSERRRPSMTFSDVTDATGEDFADRDTAARQPDPYAPPAEREPADLSFGAPTAGPTVPAATTGAAPATDRGADTPDGAADSADDLDARGRDYGLDRGATKAEQAEQAELRKTGT